MGKVANVQCKKTAAVVRAAARATHAHDFVSRLPQGYDTLLAEAPMSGGEAQRLGLARAWHADRLLVLDDATSSLDMVTEMQISRTLTGDQASDPPHTAGPAHPSHGVFSAIASFFSHLL